MDPSSTNVDQLSEEEEQLAHRILEELQVLETLKKNKQDASRDLALVTEELDMAYIVLDQVRGMILETPQLPLEESHIADMAMVDCIASHAVAEKLGVLKGDGGEEIGRVMQHLKCKVCGSRCTEILLLHLVPPAVSLDQSVRTTPPDFRDDTYVDVCNVCTNCYSLAQENGECLACGKCVVKRDSPQPYYDPRPNTYGAIKAKVNGDRVSLVFEPSDDMVGSDNEESYGDSSTAKKTAEIARLEKQVQVIHDKLGGMETWMRAPQALPQFSQPEAAGQSYAGREASHAASQASSSHKRPAYQVQHPQSQATMPSHTRPLDTMIVEDKEKLILSRMREMAMVDRMARDRLLGMQAGFHDRVDQAMARNPINVANWIEDAVRSNERNSQMYMEFLENTRLHNHPYHHLN